MSKEYSRFQFARDVLFETDKDLKKHIVPSPPVKVRRSPVVKREPNVPLWETLWREGERVLFDKKKGV